MNIPSHATVSESNASSRELELLLSINNAIVTIRDNDELFRKISALLRPIFGHDAATVGVFESSREVAHLFMRELFPEVEESQIFKLLFANKRFQISLKNSPITELLITSKPRIVYLNPLVEQYPNFIPFQLMKIGGIKESMTSPLFYSGEMIGILNLVSKKTGHFQETWLPLFEKVANQVALAVSNAFAYQELEQRKAAAQMQLKVSNVLTSITNRDVLFQAIAKEMNTLTPFGFFMVRVENENHKLLSFTNLIKNNWGEIEPISESDWNRHLDTESATIGRYQREELLSLFSHPMVKAGEDFNAWCEENPFAKFARETYGVHSILYLPIKLKERWALIIICRNHPEQYLDETDLELLHSLSPQIGLALENLFAFEKIELLKKKLEEERAYLIDEIKTVANFEEIIGISPALERTLREVSRVAETDTTVLITGETGTGKELIARAIHNLSPRKHKPLIKLNCAALPAQLIESELFGHERGSFTGAFEKRLGKFELADGGSIFLDEVGELPLDLQTKLLRVLQEREFERLGGKSVIRANVRVIAATNRDLHSEMQANRFRSDLYFRLSVFPLFVPPLRERKDDIPILLYHFIERFSKKMGKRIERISEETLSLLQAYEWPGNIRELEHLTERGMILSRFGEFSIENLLPARSKAFLPISESVKISAIHASLKTISPEENSMANITSLKVVERNHILNALKACNGKVSGKGGAAEWLGMKPTTLESKMKKLGIEKKHSFE